MNKFIQLLFGFFNLDIRRKRKSVCYCNIEMTRGLERLNSIALNIKTIIDVGAAEGSWTISAKSFWPDADFVLFEPLEERKEILRTLASNNKNIHIIPFAAGKEKSIANFIVTGDLDGSGIADEKSGESRIVQVTSIQDEVKRLKLQGPYIVKLDTHGFEVPIIEGCHEIMDQVSVFIIECYGFHITGSSLLFWEMCQYMSKLGFRLIDLVDIMHRPKDNAFWQCDAFFIRDNSSIFESNQYN